MLDLLIEGLDSIRLPCTLGLLVPGLGPAVAARSKAWQAALGFVVMSGLIAWARAAGLWFDDPGAILQVVVGLALAGSVVMSWKGDQGRFPLAGLGGALSGLIAGWLWVPCVGLHLGEELSRAGDERAATLVPLMVYVMGVSLPLIALAALPYAWPKLSGWRDHTNAARVGIAVGAIVAFGVAVGYYEDIVLQLFRISNN